MTSSLTWLDYSERDRSRAMEVIDLFREGFTVDELGLAAVRDSFADLFFPGTSTVQTRACYFLLVPWTFLRLERLRVSSSKIISQAREEELRLSKRMLAGEDKSGVFGRRAGKALKRLPSEVYWGGLRSWGICTFPGHKWGYFRSLDSFYRRLHRFKGMPSDPEGRKAPPANWHPHLPKPPKKFPAENVSVALRRQDAQYLRDRIQARHPRTLLAVLAGRADPADLTFGRPWELSHLGEIEPSLREDLHHAELFAVCMQGAALLYNLMLSELQGHKERIETYRKELEAWAAEARALEKEIEAWQLDGVWRVVRRQGRFPAYPMRFFVQRWVDILKRDGADVIAPGDSEARELVREREIRLKGSRSRFTSPRHLELWSGRSGTGRLDYRWRAAKRTLKDIFAAMTTGKE